MDWFYFFLSFPALVILLGVPWWLAKKFGKKEPEVPPWGSPVEKTKRNQIGGGQGEE